MKRTKKAGKKKKRKKRSLKSVPQKTGPKSSCTDEVIEEAYRLCLLGLTNRQLADHFGKDKTTISYWYKTNPKFRQAIDKGRQHADGKAAKRLFEIGMGYYEQDAVKFFKIPVTEREYDEEGNVVSERKYHKIVTKHYTKRFQPDRKALEKFLAVRNRATWGESYKVEHKHAHMHIGDTNIHTILEQVSDEQNFSTDELKTIAKLGLSQQAQQITNGQ